MRRKGYRKDAIRARLSSFFYSHRVDPVTPAELAAAQSHGEHDAVGGATEVDALEARHPGEIPSGTRERHAEDAAIGDGPVVAPASEDVHRA